MNLKTQTFNSSRLELWLPGSIVQVSNTQATQWVREYIYLRLQFLQNSVSVSAGTSLYYSRTVNKFHRNSPSWVFLSIPAVQKATIGSASAHTCNNPSPLGHLWGCTNTTTLEISCHAFLLPHTCVKQLYFCYFQLVEEEQRKSAYTQRLHDIGAGWWSWTNSGCAHSKHSCLALFDLWKPWKLQCRGQSSASAVFLTAIHCCRRCAFLFSCAEGWILLVSKTSFYEYFQQL